MGGLGENERVRFMSYGREERRNVIHGSGKETLIFGAHARNKCNHLPV